MYWYAGEWWLTNVYTSPYLVMFWRTHSSRVFFAPIFHFSAAAERRVTEGRSREIVQPSVHDATEKGESLLVPASCSISWLRRSSWRVFSSIWEHGQPTTCITATLHNIKYWRQNMCILGNNSLYWNVFVLHIHKPNIYNLFVRWNSKRL